MKRQNKKVKIWGWVIVGVAVILGVGGWLWWEKVEKKAREERQVVEVNQTSGKKEKEKQDEQNIEKPTETSEPAEPKPEDHKTPVKFENEEELAQNVEKIDGFVNFKDVVNDKLTINTLINSLLKAEGKCRLELKHVASGKVIAREVKTGSDPTTSYCESFLIEKGELDSGKWTISITVKSGNKSGLIKDEVIL